MSEMRGKTSVSDATPLSPNEGTGFPVCASRRNMPMPAVEDDAQLPAIAPEGRAAQLPSAAGQDLAQLVCFAVESPQLLAGFGIESRNAVVRRRHV